VRLEVVARLPVVDFKLELGSFNLAEYHRKVSEFRLCLRSIVIITRKRPSLRRKVMEGKSGAMMTSSTRALSSPRDFVSDGRMPVACSDEIDC
jgi:hypothetical protein